ncbi:uncharacterized protein A4U43_C04F1050 [Asparagus officinalis]|uniref:RING-type domain-containing protein n=1 Tax=Asparagus officinalis TaxID=4686 RepID=A0A5P1F209_ASPOF|nr:uncharacterized protein A4U43_C04F1050 [Asparagus officinalis]
MKEPEHNDKSAVATHKGGTGQRILRNGSSGVEVTDNLRHGYISCSEPDVRISKADSGIYDHLPHHRRTRFRSSCGRQSHHLNHPKKSECQSSTTSSSEACFIVDASSISKATKSGKEALPYLHHFEARYKFLSALEGDKQQLQRFYNACRGLSQQNSYVPVAPPDARPTPNPCFLISAKQLRSCSTTGRKTNSQPITYTLKCVSSAPPDARPTPNPSHIHSNVSAAPAPSHSPVPEDVQLAMAINASIQSALAEGVPIPNPQPVNLSTNTNGWAPSENTTTTTYNGWGQSSGAPPPSKVATTSDPFNGWSGVRPSSSSPHLHNSQLETPSVLPSAHEAPPTVTVPSAPPTVTVPSAPPLAEETFYPGPVQYPTIDSSQVDLSVPAAGSKAEPFDPKEDSSGGESSSCVICLDAPVEGACIPCGHMAGCMSCLNEIKGKKWGCPVCCANIDQVIRLYAV